MKRTILTIAGILTSILAMAQEGNGGSFHTETYIYGVMILAGITLFVAVYYMLYVISYLTREIRIKALREKGVSEEEIFETGKSTIWYAIQESLAEAVPVEEERKVMMDHEYDGIRELDNDLPSWWRYLFYATIVFSVVYMLHYHVLGTGKLQADEYQAQIRAAEIASKQASVGTVAEGTFSEEDIELLTDESALSDGRETYKFLCATCHGDQGEGGVGPNLTDSYYLHGGSIEDIYAVIKNGVPQKGMIAWKTQLRPEQILEVSSYVKKLEGKNPPNQKEPQGELYKPEVKNEAGDTISNTEG